MLSPQYLLEDHDYGIQFYQKLKKAFQSFSLLKFKSNKNFFLLTMGWIFSRPKKLAKSNRKIMDAFFLSLKVLGDKIQKTFCKLQPY